MRTRFTAAVTSLVLVLTMAACSSTDDNGGDGAASITEIDASSEQALGGADSVAAMQQLYSAATAGGQTTVTVYGPGENDREPLYDLFEQRFPEIDVQGVYIVGPQYASKLEAEKASGQRVADLVQSGDTSVAAQIGNGYFEKYEPITASGLDRATYADASGTVLAASAYAFGFMYNTNEISAEDAPAGWDDLTAPGLEGKLTSEDVTHFGGGFSTLSHMLWDGRYDDAYLNRLAEQNITFQSSGPAAGTAVATGQFAINPFYPLSFYMNEKSKGAPVDFVFPTEGGTHLSPHYLALLDGAPNPDAAKLLMTWLFAPEAQAGLSDIGIYPVMPGASGPAGYPAADQLDLLEPFDLSTVNEVAAANLERVQTAFDR